MAEGTQTQRPSPEPGSAQGRNAPLAGLYTQASRQAELPEQALLVAPTILVAQLADPDEKRTSRALASACFFEGSAIDLPRNKARVLLYSGARDHAHALEVFLEQTVVRPDYLLILDGADLLYPSWLASVDQHLRRGFNPDAIGYLPRDFLQVGLPEEGELIWELDGGAREGGVWLSACVDGVHPCGFSSAGTGPEGGPFDPWSMAWARPALLSRLAVEALHPFQPLDIAGGDGLWMMCRLLALYQSGNLNVRLSMASDLYLEDRIDRPATYWPTLSAALKRTAMQILHPSRSGLGELPVIYPRSGCGELDPAVKIRAAARACLDLHTC